MLNCNIGNVDGLARYVRMVMWPNLPYAASGMWWPPTYQIRGASSLPLPYWDMAYACGLRIALVPHLPYHEHEASPSDVLETGSHLGLGCLSEGGA